MKHNPGWLRTARGNSQTGREFWYLRGMRAAYAYARGASDQRLDEAARTTALSVGGQFNRGAFARGWREMASACRMMRAQEAGRAQNLTTVEVSK